MKMPLTLAIDTSCDETSASVVEGLTVLSNIQPSQIKFHKKYGGVVPSVAKLAHEERIDNVVIEALEKAHKNIEDMDFISVTGGPGLAMALEIGIKKAKELAIENNKPLMIINHMEGHLLSAFALPNSKEESNFEKNLTNRIISKNTDLFPVLGLLVSGKHTEILEVNDIGEYKILGETVDDACGEAFDKCGRMIGLGYPAGKTIAQFAEENRKNVNLSIINNNKSKMVRAESKITREVYDLPIGMTRSGDLNFSYSGLKTAFRRLILSLIDSKKGYEQLTHSQSTKKNLSVSKFEEDQMLAAKLNRQQIMDLCTAFEEAAFAPIIIKLEKVLKSNKYSEVWMGGGVVSNVRLRSKVRSLAKKYEATVRFPYTDKLNTDNAAMIGIAANLKFLIEGEKALLKDSNEIEKIDRDPTIRIDEVF